MAAVTAASPIRRQGAAGGLTPCDPVPKPNLLHI